MADKPSRALVLYGAGHAALLPTPSAVRLDSFAASAACGFLSLRSPSPDDAEEKNTTILELAQLLDAYDLHRAKNVEGDGQPTGPTISERFMGLRAAVVTDCPRVSSFAACLGFRVLGAEDLIVQSDASSGQEDADEIRMVARLLGLLGFSGGNVQETYEFDLVFVHVSADKTANKLDWIDKLVGAIMEAAPSGSAIASRVHVSVVLSYGSASESEDQCSLISNSSAETNSDLCLLRPRQSYSLKAGHTLDDVRHHHPMLLAQWQEGVTRIDLAKVFSFDEFVKHGGNFAMLAERFLHEVAFKLWKAPKYGA